MDEMKRAHEIDGAIREVVQRRDTALTKVPALSPARQTALTALVVRQFPIEAVLHEVAAKRDKALHGSAAKIPAPVESILQRQPAAAGTTSDGRHAPLWLTRFRSPIAAVLTACALITAAVLGLGRWEVSRRYARNLPSLPPAGRINVESGMDPFMRTVAIGPFNLNNNEPASLQVPFLADRRIRLADGNDTPLGLRLDLPMRAALMEDGLARTP